MFCFWLPSQCWPWSRSHPNAQVENDELPGSHMWLLAWLSSSRAIRLSTYKQQGTAYRVSVPCHVELFNKAINFTKANKRRSTSKRDITIFCSLIMKMTFYHLSSMLLATSKSLGCTPVKRTSLYRYGTIRKQYPWGHPCLPATASDTPISPFSGNLLSVTSSFNLSVLLLMYNQ